MENGWPGLAAEAREICAVLNLPNITVTAVSQQDIDTSIKSANKAELVKEMEKSSKLKHLVEEDFERKEYLENKNVTQARVKFAQSKGQACSCAR